MLRMILFAVCITLAAADVAERQVSVRVVDPGRAKSVADLGPADFELSQAGERRELVSAHARTVPLDLMFVVERRRWDPADSLVTRALESVQVRLTPQDTAGITAIDHQTKKILEAGSSPVEFAGALTRPSVAFNGGIIAPLPRPIPDSDKGPALLDAISSAAQDLGELDQSGRQRAIIVIALNKERSSQTSMERAIELAANASAIVSLVELPEEPLRDPREPRLGIPPRYPAAGVGEPPLRRPLPPLSGASILPVIRATGGEFKESGGPTLAELVERIRRPYVLTYRSSADAPAASVKLSQKGRTAHPKAVVLIAP
jgi:hypothetical protein